MCLSIAEDISQESGDIIPIMLPSAHYDKFSENQKEKTEKKNKVLKQRNRA
jgi:hypothetical protein